MSKMLENRKVRNLILFVLFLMTCWAMFNAFHIFFNIIGCGFEPLIPYSSFLISYSLVAAYFILLYKNYFVSRSNNVGLWIFSIIMILFKILALVTLVPNFPTFMEEFKYHTINIVFPFDVIFLLVVEFIFDGFIIVKAIKEKGNKTYLRYRKKTNFILAFLIGFMAVLGMYYIGVFLNSFKGIDNVNSEYGVGYVILMVLCGAPMISFYSAFKAKEDYKKPGKGELIGAILSFAVLVSLLVYKILYSDFVVQIGKPIFEIDFFGSYVIGPTILIVINSIFVIRYIIRCINNNRGKKSAI